MLGFLGVGVFRCFGSLVLGRAKRANTVCVTFCLNALSIVINVFCVSIFSKKDLSLLYVSNA